MTQKPSRLPLLAVRDVVVFPYMLLPLSVGRAKSIAAVEAAMAGSKLLAVVAQKDIQLEDPQSKDLFALGVLCEVVQFMRMPDGTLKVFLQGHSRAATDDIVFDKALGYWEARLDYPEEPACELTPQVKALMRHAVEVFDEYLKLARRPGADQPAQLAQATDPSRLADTIAANALVKASDRQTVLEILDPRARLEKIVELLKAELEIMSLERKIHTRVRSQIEKSQKEYYLTEQMKAIQKELRQKDDFAKEIEDLRKAIIEAKMPKEAQEAAVKETARLEKMMSFSPESTVSRTYLDWMIHLPWSKRTRDNLNLERASRILDDDHYGLAKAKERIIEYLAVLNLTKSLKGPILCFVGPPGVGKTSMGRSIAKAMGRKFTRLSLGGVRDEAEIRGHRRTYIGSLPGRIVQSLRKAFSKNPIFLLDEIDKMGMDWRGDPAAALLEVLDPEQNSTFLDHYLDVPFDLSQVFFICTANTLEGIPISLQDRLEVLRFPGYTHQEKSFIAKKHLLPRQLKDHGLKNVEVSVSDAAMDLMIEDYTREAGVRHLERELAGLSRKAARKVAAQKLTALSVDEKNLSEYLGIPKFLREKACHNGVGVCTGLAWTEVGGVTMTIEVAAMPGKGNLQLTGKLGSVMVESAQAAYSYLKSIASRLGIAPERFRKFDYHIHVPEGATPKDGPSAGISMATALASILTGRPVLGDLAMTGEITLRGRVLPIGGLKEKTLAAHRDGIKTVLFPELNGKDLEDIPAEISAVVKMIPVKNFDEVLELSLGPAVENANPLGATPGPKWLPQPQKSPLPPQPGAH